MAPPMRFTCCHDQEDTSEGEDVGDEDESEGLADSISFTAVPEHLFSTPEPTSRSGGTAAFFSTRYVGPAGAEKERWGRTASYWLAKDLERAIDELEFYENISRLGPKYKLLHKWAMEYGGVLTTRCEGEHPGQVEPEPRRLMLLRNLRDGLKRLRMLDIKVGDKTAVAGWQGKSFRAASRQMVVDHLTNSSVQGFRLEGFDTPPEALVTQLAGEPQGCLCLKVGKRHQRFQLQRLDAPLFLRHWIDFTSLQPLEADKELLLAVEYSEALLFDAIGQLATLCVDAQQMPVPQMWIGSSVALGCEGEALPKRTDVRRGLGRLLGAVTHSTVLAPSAGLALVKVFDWGRSELNTEENHSQLTPEAKEMRSAFWPIWQRGVVRLMFDALCLYTSQFVRPNGSPATTLEICVWDVDTFDPSDRIGSVVVPLVPTGGPVVLPLDPGEGYPLSAKSHRPEVTVELSTSKPPAGSRLDEIWHVNVVKVSDLPRMDWWSDSDPMVEVLVGPPHLGEGRPKAYTPVVYNDHNATFDARLDFGFVRPDVAESLLQMVNTVFGETVDPSCLRETATEKEAETFDRFLSATHRFSELRPPRGFSRFGTQGRHRASTASSAVSPPGERRTML